MFSVNPSENHLVMQTIWLEKYNQTVKYINVDKVRTNSLSLWFTEIVVHLAKFLRRQAAEFARALALTKRFVRILGTD